ncbi:RRQRL motif-containing zinc-binding protein [Kibdelosporangium aridum]|uniref:Uncharacterized protein n=1 Tax=Kibdelosporangium aridum TaxID=2030 RepID=A0A1W2EWQ3_KIBAR|nr:RRQRL motif-containing zinc-binding protein [Kibdelosporangium aridum]SMD14137.1 hypothetical protein SAMN05661093_04977 [Kibdelosporangium aridum]
MGRRQYPWVWADVPWSEAQLLTRGKHDGLPLLSKGLADRAILATRRQLRRQGLRPGGQDPVAILYFYSRKAGGKVFANLYLIAKAKPVRPMTPAKWHALNKANLARRTCPECHRDVLYVIYPSVGMCFACLETSETTKAAQTAA